MPDSAVLRLRLRAPVTAAANARFLVEDALRLADPDDRLLVLRRLDMGRLASRTSRAQWANRASERVRAQAARAVHAATPGAASADAVWFHSFAEARALLLGELAAGRKPAAWFWRLAVRDWEGHTLVDWLPRLLADVGSDPSVEVAVARMLVDMVEAGRLPALIVALAALPRPGIATGALRPGTPARASRPAILDTQQPVISTDTRNEALIAQATLRRLAEPVWRAVMLAVVTMPPTHPARFWLVRLALIAAEPGILSQPDTLAAWTEALVTASPPPPSDGITSRHASGPADIAGPPPLSPAHQTHPEATDAPPRLLAAAANPPSGPAAPRSRPIPEAADAPGPASPLAAEPMRAHDPADERRSVSAGLFLLVGPLVRLHFPAWLDDHPVLAAQGFPRTLLHAIARRMRVPADDPVFAVLRGADDHDWPAPLTAWRVGLDRWLRRTVRTRLDQVVHRRGWIVGTQDDLSIRFRVDDADIRLRRMALDVDPGWVPWLGCTLRYHYRDQPLA